MRIHKLELFGFKSFADRTSFSFGRGISCVVGPNGCGKSNVVDALRWCIGEQSAKSLRGGEMQDVIFAGSAQRKPVGYAEVGITLTRDDGVPFPGEFARFEEIEVCRRLYRTGASEYLINRSRVRRRDIVDLFMDTGVGNNLYSFIEQGRIDKIVSASPLDRRSLIDEAAGITRYKQRRAEATLKMEATAGQLDRAADVVEEMGRRLRTLERQVVKAARFRRLRERVRQLEIHLSLAKFADLAASRAELDAEIREFTSTFEHLEAQVSEMTNDVHLRQEECELAEGDLESRQADLSELDAQRREAAAASSFHTQRSTELRESIAASRRELEDAETRQAEAQDEHAACESERADLDASLDDRRIAAESGRSAHEAAVRDRDTARGTLHEVRARHQALDSELRSAERRAEEVRAGLERIPERIARIEGQLAALADDRIVLTKRATVAEEVLGQQREATVVCEEAVAAREAELATARDAEDAARAEAHAAESDLSALQGRVQRATEAADRAAVAASRAADEAAASAMEAEQVRFQQREQELAAAAKSAAAYDREILANAEARARAWIGAADSAQREDIERLRGAERAAIESAWREAGAAVDAWSADAVARLEALESKLDAELSSGVASARDAVDTARRAAQTHRQSLLEAEARFREARAAVADSEGVVRSLDARRIALEQAESATSVVYDILPGARPLADSAEADADALAGLGARLLLPLVRSVADVQAVQDALGEGDVARLLYVPASVEDVAAHVLGERAPAADLVGALDQADGGAWVPGAGVDVAADGVVTLGRAAGEAAAELVAVRRDAAAAAERLDVAQQALSRAEARFGELEAQTGELDHAVDSAREALTAEEQRITSEKAKRLEEARREQASEHQARDARRASDRDAKREALEARLVALESEHERALASLREEADTVLSTLRDEQAREAAKRRAAADKALAVVRDETATKVREAREAASADAGRVRDDARRQLQELTGSLERLRKGLASKREEATARAVTRSTAQQALDAARAAERETSVVVVRMDAELATVREQLGAADRRRGELSEALDETTRERMRLEDALKIASESSARARESLGGLTDDLAAATEAVSESEAAEARLAEARSEAESTWASAREQRAAVGARASAAQQRAADAAERALRERERVEEFAGQLADSDERAAGLATTLAQADSSLETARARHQQAVERLGRARHALGEVRETWDRIGKERTTTRDALLAREREQHRVGMELEATTDRMDERYQFDLARALAQLDAADALALNPPEELCEPLEIGRHHVPPATPWTLRRAALDDEQAVRDSVGELETVREQLGKIGDVNLTALDEYQDLKFRFDELDQQRQDLEDSLASIKDAIARMNKMCRERFREAFDAVNEVFQEAYPSLVGGGEARLSLTDEEDLLEAGVEIFVRPPGKRMQNLTLLSGGEKAMTAIALLLALFTVKPSPFCVLDEVDAPLDEANGSRFNDMIRKMAAFTQFIVITHNRKTMECADTLYGITMPSPGCSGLVSVQVD